MNGRVGKLVHPMQHVHDDVVPRDTMVYADWKKDKVAQPCGEIGAKSSDSDASYHIRLAQVPSNAHIMRVTRDIANENGVGSMTTNLSQANVAGGCQRTQRPSCVSRSETLRRMVLLPRRTVR